MSPEVAGEALKPCPFCGGKPHHTGSLDYRSMRCDCGAEGPSNLNANDAEAIAAWNRRAVEPQASTEPHCANCRGDRWVCENHRSEAQGHDGCGGAGEPCPACNPLASDFARVLHERDELRREVEALRAAGGETVRRTDPSKIREVIKRAFYEGMDRRCREVSADDAWEDARVRHDWDYGDLWALLIYSAPEVQK